LKKSTGEDFGWALSLLFHLVFSGNIAQYLDGKDAFGALNSYRHD